MLTGSSSNNPLRSTRGDVVVKLSTIEVAGPEAFLAAWDKPSFVPKPDILSFFGDSGEKEGNEVKDLSEGATDEAELEA